MSLTGSINDVEGHILDEQVEFKDLLDSYSIRIGKIANLIGILFFTGMMVRYYLEMTNKLPVYHEHGRTKADMFAFILRCIIISITLVISIIPEAISLAVIYCLSEYSSLMMFKNGKIVFRKLKSLENMGRVNCLCLEKQGTFTLSD